MARKAKVGPRRKRGRPYNPNSRRNQSTRAGRRGEVDHGSPRLRARKLALTTREDIELTAAGVLYGHGHLDNAQYSALGWVTGLLRRVARSCGRLISPAGIWNAILGALVKTTPGMEPIVGDQGARRALEHILRRLDGSKDLVIALAAEDTLPPVCIRAAEHRLTPRDLVQLELLRRGLDGISPPHG
jgi:hypothetical protein